MLRKIFVGLVALTFISSVEQAHASLISADDAVFGVSSITRDTSTNFEWLDLTLTTNRTYNDISSQLGFGGEFEGFRYATGAELNQLFTNAGLTIGVVSAANFDPAVDFHALFGTTCFGNCGSFWLRADGFYGDLRVIIRGTIAPRAWVHYRSLSSVGDQAVAHVSTNGNFLDSAFPSVGHWLVREGQAPDPVPVPAPAAIYLISLGIAALSFVTRRRVRQGS